MQKLLVIAFSLYSISLQALDSENLNSKKGLSFGLGYSAPLRDYSLEYFKFHPLDYGILRVHSYATGTGYNYWLYTTQNGQYQLDFRSTTIHTEEKFLFIENLPLYVSFGLGISHHNGYYRGVFKYSEDLIKDDKGFNLSSLGFFVNLGFFQKNFYKMTLDFVFLGMGKNIWTSAQRHSGYNLNIGRAFERKLGYGGLNLKIGFCF
jgi:hypothetical protein